MLVGTYLIYNTGCWGRSWALNYIDKCGNFVKGVYLFCGVKCLWLTDNGYVERKYKPIKINDGSVTLMLTCLFVLCLPETSCAIDISIPKNIIWFTLL